jgi:hypothetical protein
MAPFVSDAAVTDVVGACCICCSCAAGPALVGDWNAGVHSQDVALLRVHTLPAAQQYPCSKKRTSKVHNSGALCAQLGE